MARYIDFGASIILLLVVHLEQLVLHKRAFVEGRMEEQFEKCCGLGASWAKENLRCEKFTGPVPGVAAVEQGLCLETVDICCVRAYHELQCEKGKSDARQGLACVTSTQLRTPGRGDYHRDCCEGCKLGILTGSMAQGCSFKSFSFGIPWDPAFLECCHESSPSSTTDLTSELTSESTETTSDSSSPSSPSSPYSSSSSSSYSPSPSSSYSPSPSSSYSPSSSSSSSPSSFSSSSFSSSTSPVSSSSDDSSSSSSGSTLYSSPTPELDDICQLMKGMLCTDICVPTPGSYYCKCRDGFTLLEDGKTCRQDLPTDRCKSTNPCEQRCTDNGVAVICSCNPGYNLAGDGRSCIPKSPKKTPSKDEDNELSPLCPSGYRYNSSKQVCDDVDECLERDVCPGERCQNTIGSYICITEKTRKRASYEACPPGYQWDLRTSVCGDIDECTVLSDACPTDKPFCVNTQGSYTCLEMTGVRTCPAGFKFDKISQQCKDVDECAENIHSCLADVEQCRNTEGAYECDVKCGKGFTYNIGLGVCVDVDECVESSNSCPDPSTICVNTDGAYECVKIRANFLPQPPIRKEDSSNRRDNTQPDLLTCSAGYKPVNDSGMTKCIDVDECNEQLHSCDPDERCVNEIGSYRCLLDVTSTTEKSSDDRYDRPYKIEGTSTRSTPVANENCGSGYFFDVKSRLCVDVDECANGLAACGINERCVNAIGGYRCSPVCPAGFQPRNDSRFAGRVEEACDDINECSLGLHTCNALTHYCFNTNGSYACEALTTTITTTTTRISTSSTTTPRTFIGSRYNRVQNTDYYWSIDPCRLGYKRDSNTGYCMDIDECTVGPGCRDHEKCMNTPGGYDCSPLCSIGWYFSMTTKGCQDVDECLLGRHDCPQGTHRCVNTNGSFVCELIPPCSRGFKRAFNGSCLDIDECSESLHNCRLDLHQYCVNREGGFECLTRLPFCPTGYQYSLGTRRCEDIDECLVGRYKCDARFSERCINLPGTYRCERPPLPPRQRQQPACPSGYRYHPKFRMCTDIDECAEKLDVCGDEVCYNQPGGYSCAKAPLPMTRRQSTTAMPAPANQKCVDGTKFVRNRGCVDVNECRELEDACSSNEECVNTMGSYQCICKTGFRRDNLTQACVDINECQLQENDCLPTQRCDNTIGSYTCTRFLPCGTGYTLNAATEICEDDDECVLGTHDCGSGYQCRNTLGSYRCDRISRIPTPQPRTSQIATRTTTTTTTTTPKSLTPDTWPNCPRGFEPGSSGKCMDIDECQRTPNPCSRTMQMCLNTMGSYRCVSRVICGTGYALDASGQYCVDVDECQERTHECGKGQTCENRRGGYHCVCPSGHAVGPNNDDCVDIDECSIYGNSICGSNSRCENTVGSYKCLCEEGFENVGGDGAGACNDVDECQRTPGLCQQVCLNVWSSYRCGCEAGFRLNADNRSCSDIDECTEFKDHNLCIGICENTPGSYACKCPDGYRLGIDGRTCQDIDECATGSVCREADEMCQNTRGGFRCNRITCPPGYHRDSLRKNRCVHSSRYCRLNDLACLRSPTHYSYNYITFVSMLPIPSTGQLELFTMRGNHQPDSTIQFGLALVDVRAPPGVARATESCFSLKRPMPSQAVLVLTRSIPGPQEIELDLSMEIYHDTVFVGSAIAKIFIFVSQYEF